MGYLKIIVQGPGANKTIENILCLAIGARITPTTMWYDYNVEDMEFIVMGCTLKQSERLIQYVYKHCPDYLQNIIRFRLIGYGNEDKAKPKDSWEALNFMLQSFPKRRKIEDEQ